MNRMNLEWILRRVRTLAPLLVGSWLIVSCGTAESSAEGSETHFLKSCETSCEDGMQCICGVCTKACTRPSDCAAWSGVASCAPLGPRVAEQRCGAAPLDAICDVSCLTDTDCSQLAPDRVCDYGFCRQLGR